MSATDGPLAHPTYQQVLAVVRVEIRKYVDDDFSDDQRLHRDLKIVSDDLSAIAMDLERTFKTKPPRSDYHIVLTAADLAHLFYRTLSSRA